MSLQNISPTNLRKCDRFFSLCSSSPFSISFLHPPNVNEEAGTSKHLLKLSYDYSLSMSCVVFGLGE